MNRFRRFFGLQMSRIRKFVRLRWSEKILFCESVMLHLLVGVLLKVVPFRKIPVLFAGRQFETPTLEEDQPRHMVSGRQSVDQYRYDLSGQELILIGNIKVAVQRAGAVSPWRNKCLVSSLAGRVMLNRREIHSTISLGVTKRHDGKTIAHAWLIAPGCELVEKRDLYTELYTF